jgi:hypothetical protein
VETERGGVETGITQYLCGFTKIKKTKIITEDSGETDE